MEDRTARNLQLVGLLALVILTAILVEPVVGAWVHGVSPPPTNLLYVVLILALVVAMVLLGYATNPIRRVASYFARRRGPAEAAVPADLVREAIALAKATHDVWDSHAGAMDSLTWASGQIINVVNSRLGNPDFSDQRPFVHQANGVLTAWRAQRPMEEFARQEVDAIVAIGESMSPDAFLTLLALLRGIALSGVALGNEFAQNLANARVADLPRYLTDGWRTYKEKANRLVDDLTKLGEKANQKFPPARATYIPQVRDL